MELYLKAIAGALITVLLALVVSKQNKEGALLLVVFACCMIAAAIVSYLDPVMDFINHLQDVANLDTNILEMLLKSVGIAVVSEVAVQICEDMGNGAMGKTIQFLSTAVILWLSLPLLQKLISLIEGILVSL